MHTNAVFLWVLLVVLYNFVIFIIIYQLKLFVHTLIMVNVYTTWQTTDDENLAIYTNTEFHETPLNGFRRVGYQVLKE